MENWYGKIYNSINAKVSCFWQFKAVTTDSCNELSENGFQQQTIGCHHRPQNKNKSCQQQASSPFSLL